MPITAPTSPAIPAPNPGQPPTGSSPATTPVPNKGLEAAGLAKLGLVVRLMEQIVPLLGAGTEAGKDLLKCLTTLAKHIPPGAVSPGVEESAMMKLQNQMRQQTPQIAQMRAASAGGAPGGASPSPPMPVAA